MTEQTRMLLTLKQIKPGMRVTLVSKGIINSFNSTYVDPTRIGYTSFFQVTSVGKQYLYGKHIYYDQLQNAIRITKQVIAKLENGEIKPPKRLQQVSLDGYFQTA